MKVFNVIMLLSTCAFVVSTPPACFLSCINEMARECPKEHLDFECLCAKQDQVLGCLVDICPYSTFESSRDHYFGTCLEHGQPTYGNYPPSYKPGEDNGPKSTSSHKHKTITYTIPRSSTATSTETGIETPCTDDYPPTEVPGIPEPTETPIFTAPESTIWPVPTESPNTPESDPDCDPEDKEEQFDECEWEEEETIDENGTITIIRTPINVPQKYLEPPFTGNKKRILIIKWPKTISDKPFETKDIKKDVMNKTKDLKKNVMNKVENARNKGKDAKQKLGKFDRMNQWKPTY